MNDITGAYGIHFDAGRAVGSPTHTFVHSGVTLVFLFLILLKYGRSAAIPVARAAGSIDRSATGANLGPGKKVDASRPKK